MHDVYRLRSKVLGETHPDTLCTLNNLAQALDELGEHRKAPKAKLLLAKRRRKAR